MIDSAATRLPARLDWAVRMTLLLAASLAVMSSAAISPALPAIRAAFAGVENIDFWVRLLLTLPALFIVIGAPAAGMIVDRTQRRKPLLIASVALYGVSGLWGYLAQSLTMILISRAVLGLAVAGILTTTATLIAAYYSGRTRAQFLGYQAAFMGVGGVVFLTLGGVLADVNWHTPFLVYLLAFAVLPLVFMYIYEPARPPAPAPGTAAAGRAPLGLMLFVYGVTALTQVVFNLVPVQIPFLLGELVGASASQAGLVTSFMPVFFALTSAMGGRINARFNHIPVIAAGFLIAGAAYLLLGSATGWGMVLLALPIGGVGIGLIMPNVNIWLNDETPPALRGRVLGGITTSLFLGQFASPILAQPILDATGSLSTMYAVVGALVLVTAAIIFIARGRLERLGSGDGRG